MTRHEVGLAITPLVHFRYRPSAKWWHASLRSMGHSGRDSLTLSSSHLEPEQTLFRSRDYCRSSISGTLRPLSSLKPLWEAHCHGIATSRLCSWTHERRAAVADPPSSGLSSVDATVLARRGHFLWNACARYRLRHGRQRELGHWMQPLSAACCVSQRIWRVRIGASCHQACTYA